MRAAWLRRGAPRCWAALLGLLSLLAGCQNDTRPNIVLITIDTLRSDHCSFHGYERSTTPFLQELADRSAVFENAYGTSSWTAPSMASLFTSLPPRAHGVTRGFVFDGRITDQDYLSDDFDTLAETLSSHGYATYGVSTNAHLTAATGFAQGFDELTELWMEDASQANFQALRFRDRLVESQPYFLWVHYFDPHRYGAREPWYGEYRGEREPTAKPSETSRSFLEDVIDRYDSEIRYTDEHLRTLFTELDLDSNALVIVTSDHGEGLWDHDVLGHSQSLFEEEILVPLIIRLPGQGPQRVTSQVSLVDIAPTILDASGIEVGPRVAGRSLLPTLRGEISTDRVVVTELERGAVAHHALRWHRWKLYQTADPQASVRLFDLEADPAEKHDLAPVERQEVRGLKRRLRLWASRWPRFEAPRRAASFGRDELDQLRALGYLREEADPAPASP